MWSPRMLVDAVIVLTVIEAVWLAVHHRRTGRGVAPAEVMPNLASGLALMLAVRAGIEGAGPGWVAAGLAVAGLLHAADLRRRWRR